jgi:RimJ/RimL family protein N-acetyltransferase
VTLEPVIDAAHRDAIMRGDLGKLGAAPGWPHEDSAPGLAFIDSGGWTFLVIDDDGRVSGECGTKTPPDANGVVEIGYGLAAPSRGRGLGSAAVQALVNWLAARDDVQVIEAEVHTGNVASWRVLERIGFRMSGDAPSGYRRYSLSLSR